MRRVLDSRFSMAAAEMLGRGLRLAVVAASRAGLSVLGVALVSVGLAMAWPPLAFIALGCAVLAVDRGRAR